MVGIAVAMTVASIDAIKRLSMMPATITSVRRDTSRSFPSAVHSLFTTGFVAPIVVPTWQVNKSARPRFAAREMGWMRHKKALILFDEGATKTYAFIQPSRKTKKLP